MTRKYELTEQQAELAFNTVRDHCHAIKNWIASAVENNDPDRAKDLVKQLREYEGLYKTLNVSAHRFIDALPTAK